MASEADSSEPSPFFANLINSRNRDISLFLPFILGLHASNPLQDSENPYRETENRDERRESPDRIILINPFTQGMVVIERSNGDSSFSGFESLLNDLFSSKTGQPPASKASIDALPTVEIEGCGEGGDEQCVVCLEEWGSGEKAKEMPCKHIFHRECIEKWLAIHGSCPICRYEMPVDEGDGDKKRTGGEGGGERRRGIWVSFSFGGERRSEENNRAVSNDVSERSDS